MLEYRLYVDESGDHILSGWPQQNNRFFGITGVIIESIKYNNETQPLLEALKQHFFPHDPNGPPVILIRNSIIRYENHFVRLKNPVLREEWEQAIIGFFQQHITQIFTVVMDKQTHLDRYGEETYDPYHYCFTVLLERYRGWLSAITGRKGDILAESRGKKLDRTLKALYQEIYNNGTDYLTGQQVRDYLTSKEVKLKKKKANVAGLQLADLLANPSKIDILLEHECQLQNLPGAMTHRINEAVRTKYNPYGRVFLE